jgi:hypothetical protein
MRQTIQASPVSHPSPVLESVFDLTGYPHRHFPRIGVVGQVLTKSVM